MVEATAGVIPALIIIGRTIEPTMITAPRPLIPKKTKIVASDKSKAMERGLSPASSAAFFIIVVEIPVWTITLANIAPKITTDIAVPNFIAPPTSMLLRYTVSGICAAKAIQAASSGSASIVGNFLAIIRPAKTKNPPKIKIPVMTMFLPLGQSMSKFSSY